MVKCLEVEKVMTDRDNAFKMMEDCLLPVFSEAVKMCKEISGRDDYFSDSKNYRAGRRLYAMAFLSTAINRVNKDIVSAEHKKKNIEGLDLFEPRYFYLPSGQVSKKAEDVCHSSELMAFHLKMREMGVSYFNDAVFQDCLGSFRCDAAIGRAWEGRQPLISVDGDIVDWKKAHKLAVFKFAAAELKENMFVMQMDKENCWDKTERDKNYPRVNEICDKNMELKFAQYCQRQKEQSEEKFKQNMSRYQAGR